MSDLEVPPLLGLMTVLVCGLSLYGLFYVLRCCSKENQDYLLVSLVAVGFSAFPVILLGLWEQAVVGWSSAAALCAVELVARWFIRRRRSRDEPPDSERR